MPGGQRLAQCYYDRRSGSPRITRQLRTEDQTVSKERVARLMRKKKLRAKTARKYKATTNSNHNLPVAPNEKWVSDITYIATDEGWLYLAVALDLYGRVATQTTTRRHRLKTVRVTTSACWAQRLGMQQHEQEGRLLR